MEIKFNCLLRPCRKLMVRFAVLRPFYVKIDKGGRHFFFPFTAVKSDEGGIFSSFFFVKNMTMRPINLFFTLLKISILFVPMVAETSQVVNFYGNVQSAGPNVPFVLYLM